MPLVLTPEERTRWQFQAVPASGALPLPNILLSGVDHAGKGYQAATFSSSPLVGKTFWIPFGEVDAHSFALTPGSRIEVIEGLDGTIRNLLGAIYFAAEQPRPESGQPNVIVLDSGTVVRDVLTEEQQLVTTRRAKAQAKQKNQPEPDPDSLTIPNDLWNVVRSRWRAIQQALNTFDGVSIITGRLEYQTIFNQAGQPTKQKHWVSTVHKSAPFAAGITIELREQHARDGFVTGVRDPSGKWLIKKDEPELVRDFTIEKVLRGLGYTEEMMRQAVVQPLVEARPEAYLDELAAAERQEAEREQITVGRRAAADRGELPDPRAFMQEVAAAMSGAEPPRRALLALRTSYGASVLDALQVKTKAGPCTGNQAIDQALEIVRGHEQQATAPGGPASPQPAAPAQPAEPEPELVKAAPEVASLVLELTAQARALGTTVEAHAAGIIKALGVDDVRKTPPAKRRVLGEWVVQQRPRVVDALRVRGLDEVADAYQQSPRSDAANGSVVGQMLVLSEIPLDELENDEDIDPASVGAPSKVL